MNYDWFIFEIKEKGSCFLFGIPLTWPVQVQQAIVEIVGIAEIGIFIFLQYLPYKYKHLYLLSSLHQIPIKRVKNMLIPNIIKDQNNILSLIDDNLAELVQQNVLLVALPIPHVQLQGHNVGKLGVRLGVRDCEDFCYFLTGY